MSAPIQSAGYLQAQPLAQASALPAVFYTDPPLHATDQRAVFARSWQLVARAADLSGSGDHVLAEVSGVPLIIVRGEDQALRAFHNVCRHRAGPLALCDGRGAKALRCRYHGWTYTLAGQLRTATEMGDAEDFDIASIRLPEVSVACWQGLVFVALEVVPPLGEVMAGIDARIGQHAMAAQAFSHSISYEVGCNWKAYVDNFLEGYHLPHIHPGLNRLLDYKSYLTEIHPWYSLQYSPLEESDNFYGSGEALYYFVYPNTMLNILPGRLQTNRVVPLAVDRCRVDFDYYYPQSDAASDQERRQRDQSFSDEVQHEDIAICEAVQRGLASGSYTAGRLNPKRESGVHHFHELLRRAYRQLE